MADPSVSVAVLAPSGNRGTGIGHVCGRMDDDTIDGGEDGKWRVWAEFVSVAQPQQVLLRRGFYNDCEDVGGKFQLELVAIAFSEHGYRTCVVRKMAKDDPAQKLFCAGLVSQSGGLTINADSFVASAEAEPPEMELLATFLKSKTVAQHKRVRAAKRHRHGVIRQEGQSTKAIARRQKQAELAVVTVQPLSGPVELT